MPGIRNGLYTVETDMTDGGRGHATGVIVLRDGKIAGGDTHFYYTGTYTAADGKPSKPSNGYKIRLKDIFAMK